jgi:subtilisin family serine protease
MVALLAPGMAGAQIALPPVSVPEPGLPLPPLRPALTALDRLAPAQLAQLRLGRIGALLRGNRDRIALDADGQPALRGVLVALLSDAALIERAARAGFEPVARERIDGLDLALVRFRPPAKDSLAQAQRRLAKLLPGVEVDVDHLYFQSGAVGSSALPTAMLAAGGAGGAAPLGLIDGGVAAHPSLAGRVVQRGFAVGAPLASRHGTAVASLLAARGGPQGAAPGAALRAADVYGSDPAGGNATAIARALGWLAESGVAVTTISLVGPDNRVLAAAIRAAQQRGMLIVAAVGNDGPAAPAPYPASYPGVLAVTGVDRRLRALPEAGRSPQLAFAAPGDGVLAATGAAGSERLRGTSFAAPLVAGRLARHYPRPAVGQIRSAVTALMAEARDLGRKGRDKLYGHGLICGDCGGPD